MANEIGAMFDEFVTGGGIDDADVVIQSARFVQWDYAGTRSPILALRLELLDNDKQVHAEHLSSGELKFFQPSSDGKRAVPVGTQAKLNMNTNAVAFLLSMINADTRGQLAAKIRTTDDISVIDGTKIHVIQKAQPKRPRLEINADPTRQGQAVPENRTSLHCDKLLAYAWEAQGATQQPPAGATAAGPAVQAQAAPAGNGGAAAAGGANIEETAVGLLCQLIAENQGQPLKTGAIAGKVFTNADMKALPAPTRNAVLGMIVNPGFLGAAGRPWVYDQTAGTVALG